MQLPTLPNSPAATAARAALFALTYLAAAELGHILSFKSDLQDFATFWPPAGLLLATLALSRRDWPSLLLAAAAANLASDVLLHGKSVAVSVAFCLINGLEACCGVWLLRRFGGLPLTVARTADVLRLGGLAACLCTLLGATLGAAVVTAAYGAHFWQAFQTWWFSDALGVIMLAPPIFAWAAAPAAPRLAIRPWRIAEALLLFGGLLFAAEAVYGEHLAVRFAAPAFVLPFLLWAVMRFSLPTVTIALLLVAIFGVWHTAQGRGPYLVRDAAPIDLTVRVQGVIAVANLCILLLAATIAERRQADHDRIALVARLQQALAEIKLLQEMIPMCAWCNRIQDDRDGWQRIETYLRTHMHTDVTHGICPECFQTHFAEAENPHRHAG